MTGSVHDYLQWQQSILFHMFQWSIIVQCLSKDTWLNVTSQIFTICHLCGYYRFSFGHLQLMMWEKKSNSLNIRCSWTINNHHEHFYWRLYAVLRVVQVGNIIWNRGTCCYNALVNMLQGLIRCFQGNFRLQLIHS